MARTRRVPSALINLGGSGGIGGGGGGGGGGSSAGGSSDITPHPTKQPQRRGRLHLRATSMPGEGEGWG